MSLGSFDAGASPRSFAFAVRLDATVPAGLLELTNTATVTDDGSNGADLDPADNQATTTTAVDASPELRLTKSAPVTSVNAGELLLFTLTLTNVGSRDARAVVLSDTVPAATSFDPGASDPRWSCPATVAGSLCTLDVGTVPAQAPPQSVLFAVRVDDPLSGDIFEITNVAGAVDGVARMSLRLQMHGQHPTERGVVVDEKNAGHAHGPG